MKKILATLFVACATYVAAHAQYTENTKIKIGEPAPELEFNSPEGKTLKLSDIAKKRIVLVDFWASWCRPCRNANPRLVKLYEQYKDKKFKDARKGFTILSVSLDQNKDAWVKAIAADSLQWEYHMSDLGGWQSQPAQIYGVQFIPQAFLVDGDGNVIGKYLFAEQAEADLQKLLK